MKKDIDVKTILQNLFHNNWNETFLIDGITGKMISYGEFLEDIIEYKQKLSELGIITNDTVCLMMHNSIELITLYFACLVSQLVVVPIDPQKGNNEIKEIFSYINPKITIYNLTKFEYQSNSIDINEFKKSLKTKTLVEQKIDIFDGIDYKKTYLITFTSGSTGIPKGVIHSFNNLVSSAIAFNKKIDFDKNRIFYHNLPMTYMAGILNLIILPLITGSKIVLGERFSISNINRFWELPIKYSANTFWFIPTILELLLKLDRGSNGIQYTNESVIIGCVGTAPLDPESKIAFQERYKIQLYESYGLSETLFVTTNYPQNDLQNSVGKPLDGVELSFSEDQEIMINLPWMFLGYANLDKGGFMKNEKYLSGDVGNINDTGFLTITGRKKDLIIKGGINISPKKIESFVKQFGIFEENIIVGISDRYLGEKIVCCYIPKHGIPIEVKKKELNLEIIKRLGNEYHIDEFFEITEVPRNLSGKIDKSKIIEIYQSYTNALRN